MCCCLSKDALTDEDAAHFLESNLIKLTDGDYYLNIPYFTVEQFAKLVSLFDMTDENINDLLSEWIKSAAKTSRTLCRSICMIKSING